MKRKSTVVKRVHGAAFTQRVGGIPMTTIQVEIALSEEQFRKLVDYLNFHAAPGAKAQVNPRGVLAGRLSDHVDALLDQHEQDVQWRSLEEGS